MSEGSRRQKTLCPLARGRLRTAAPAPPLKAAAPAGPAPPAGCSHRRPLAVGVATLRMRLEAGLCAAPRGLLGLVVGMQGGDPLPSALEWSRNRVCLHCQVAEDITEPAPQAS